MLNGKGNHRKVPSFFNDPSIPILGQAQNRAQARAQGMKNAQALADRSHRQQVAVVAFKTKKVNEWIDEAMKLHLPAWLYAQATKRGRTWLVRLWGYRTDALPGFDEAKRQTFTRCVLYRWGRVIEDTEMRWE